MIYKGGPNVPKTQVRYQSLKLPLVLPFAITGCISSFQSGDQATHTSGDEPKWSLDGHRRTPLSKSCPTGNLSFGGVRGRVSQGPRISSWDSSESSCPARNALACVRRLSIQMIESRAACETPCCQAADSCRLRAIGKGATMYSVLVMPCYGRDQLR
jgi:hypothetical protein